MTNSIGMVKSMAMSSSRAMSSTGIMFLKIQGNMRLSSMSPGLDVVHWSAVLSQVDFGVGVDFLSIVFFADKDKAAFCHNAAERSKDMN